MNKYELAAKAHKNVYGIMMPAEKIREEVLEKARDAGGLLEESGAFVMWLDEMELREEFKKLKKNENQKKKQEKIKEVAIMEQNKAAMSAMEIVEKTEQKVEPIPITIDNLDEEMILAMEQAQEDLPLIYTYSEKGKEKMVLSWAGIVKAMRLQGNIRIDPPAFQVVDGKVIAMCIAHDMERNISMPGVAERASAGRMGAEFKYTVLASKAIRNAVKKIIDPDTLQKVMAEGKKRKSFVKVY